MEAENDINNKEAKIKKISDTMNEIKVELNDFKIYADKLNKERNIHIEEINKLKKLLQDFKHNGAINTYQETQQDKLKKIKREFDEGVEDGLLDNKKIKNQLKSLNMN